MKTNIVQNNDIVLSINDKIEKLDVQWVLEPFPHAIVDNFLPDEVFDKISNLLHNIYEIKDIKKRFTTDLEFNKNVYGIGALDSIMKLPIQILGSLKVKQLLQNFIGNINLISLNDLKDFGGYYPFHSMKENGFLGSHVDHSRSKTGEIHMANSLYFASKEWDKNLGGETILFNSTGYKPKIYIEPKPNRLVLFLHTSSTFHGVNFISKNAKFNRFSYYMDYYIDKKDLLDLQDNLKKKKVNADYLLHSTIFIPFFPVGLKSFKFKSLFKLKNYYPYLHAYIKYLLNRYFLKY
ncbi:2OG-Fe(II) oxygenase [Candidatus Pelagibacter sp. Uisw_106]|uniref:2OG-Fe(II) oxygenase n=1 Tax=Candidatus Pelagibacter sp. Uisw_106 TaxID=3230984 RepID=UPI0039E8B4E0